MTDDTARTVEISVSHAKAILRKLRIVASVYTGDKETRLTLVPAMEVAIAAWTSRATAPDERVDAVGKDAEIADLKYMLAMEIEEVKSLKSDLNSYMTSSAELAAENVRFYSALTAIVERSANGELGTSKVADMRKIAEGALIDADRDREGGAVTFCLTRSMALFAGAGRTLMT